MLDLKLEIYLKLLFAVSLISIISAYFIEYILGHQPCNLCLLERIPYALSIVLIIINYIFKINQKFLILLLLLLFIFSFSISVYHYGIEQGYFNESSVCGVKNLGNVISKEEILKQLNDKMVSCKDVTFRIFGLSLTSINMILSLILTIILINILTKYDKIK
jgi:disulfide bond formation protein DsbB|tara:strand:+ start:77 stop:562 length:486 start_codon:yes stop_codon:yes gene_type:complete